jgi:hypothetical protein
MKYRKKPIVIEAEQWFPGKQIEGVRDLNPIRLGEIDTLEGRMHVNPGDWVITGVKGERYPCKPDIFEASYEPVTESR